MTACPVCGGSGLVANGLPSNGPDPCPACSHWSPYYEQDGIVVYHGDCRDVLPCLSGQVSAIVTSPPYAEFLISGLRRDSR
jgi:hypothetical protein